MLKVAVNNYTYGLKSAIFADDFKLLDYDKQIVYYW